MILVFQRWRARLLYFYNEKEGVFFDEIQEAFSKEIRNMLTIWRACSSTTGIRTKQVAKIVAKTASKRI